MSTLIADVAKVLEVKDHPNADRLSIYTVKGWHVIGAKIDGEHRYKKGDLVIYCPIDSVLPQDLSDKLEITKYLSKGRLRTLKLRGIYSQGLIIPRDFVDKALHYEGANVIDALGIKKYYPPAQVTRGGLALSPNPLFSKYTGIENIKNFQDVLEEGENVVIREKVHGTNFRAAKLADGTFLVGSHNVNLKQDNGNLYWIVAQEMSLEGTLSPGQQVFGEIFGAGCQKLAYGKKNSLNLVVFDLMENGAFVDDDVLVAFCKKAGLVMPPQLHKGPWSNDLMSLADGQTLLGGQHIREGFVVKPAVERVFTGGNVLCGRAIFKNISEKYLLKDYGDIYQH